MRLHHRIKKLEDNSGSKEKAVVVYRVKEKSREQALHEWVEKYGSLGKRDPLFVEIMTFADE
ncbi:MAG: hypothetical protein HWE30_13770 [Methylocystaceae bacterium]|nr:hypothetical protein [Methylocystaceae bacterium]